MYPPQADSHIGFGSLNPQTLIGTLQDARSVDSYDTEYLTSWIPREFVALADEGITVNPEQCIQWLTETPVELMEVLHAENLLARYTPATQLYSDRGAV